MIVLAWAANGPGMFWAAANLAGVCMGDSQSAGRALVGLLSPSGQRADFGLRGLAVKLSAILGPLTYGIVSWTSQGDHRPALLITGDYFVVGLGDIGGGERQVREARSTAVEDLTQVSIDSAQARQGSSLGIPVRY